MNFIPLVGSKSNLIKADFEEIKPLLTKRNLFLTNYHVHVYYPTVQRISAVIFVQMI